MKYFARYGRFSIDEDRLDEIGIDKFAEILAAIRFVTLRTDYDPMLKRLLMGGYSRMFDEIRQGQIIPFLDIEFDVSEKGVIDAWRIKKDRFIVAEGQFIEPDPDTDSRPDH